MKGKNHVQLWLINSLNDPLVKILLKNSHLTKIQLETLLIDILAEKISNKPLKYEEKARFRLERAKISRGAFNRTLSQAKQNTIKSIYTIIILGYLGFFESVELQPYLEIANKIKNYIIKIRSVKDKKEVTEEVISIMNILKKEIELNIKESIK